MASGETHSVRNGVLATVVGGIALALLGELWPPVKFVMLWLWERLVSFVGLFGETYSVPGWVLAALSVLALVTVVRAIVALRSGPVEPYRSYAEDILFGTKWRWSWSSGDISNLWCFCTVCDGELVYNDRTAVRFAVHEDLETRFICEHCNGSIMGRIAGGNKEYALGAVRREILRKVRTGEYPGGRNVG